MNRKLIAAGQGHVFLISLSVSYYPSILYPLFGLLEVRDWNDGFQGFVKIGIKQTLVLVYHILKSHIREKPYKVLDVVDNGASSSFCRQ